MGRETTPDRITRYDRAHDVMCTYDNLADAALDVGCTIGELHETIQARRMYCGSFWEYNKSSEEKMPDVINNDIEIVNDKIEDVSINEEDDMEDSITLDEAIEYLKSVADKSAECRKVLAARIALLRGEADVLEQIQIRGQA